MSETVQQTRDRINAFAADVWAAIDRHGIEWCVMGIECRTQEDGADIVPIVTGQLHHGDLSRRAILAGALTGYVRREFYEQASHEAMSQMQGAMNVGAITRSTATLCDKPAALEENNEPK